MSVGATASHAEDVLAVREGLTAVGLTVDADELPLLDRLSSERAITRLTYSIDPETSGVGSALVVADANGLSVVRGLPIRGRSYLAPEDVASRLSGVGRWEFRSDDPTNDELRRFLAERDALPRGQVAELALSLSASGFYDGYAALTHPGRTSAPVLAAATALVADLASGVPVEWLLRRLVASRSPS